jgi:hypothetical protein
MRAFIAVQSTAGVTGYPPANASFLCYKPAELGAAIKETICIYDI